MNSTIFERAQDEAIPQNPALDPEVVEILRVLSRSGTPAVRTRGRIPHKLIERGQAGKEGRRNDR